MSAAWPSTRITSSVRVLVVFWPVVVAAAVLLVLLLLAASTSTPFEALKTPDSRDLIEFQPSSGGSITSACDYPITTPLSEVARLVGALWA